MVGPGVNDVTLDHIFADPHKSQANGRPEPRGRVAKRVGNLPAKRIAAALMLCADVQGFSRHATVRAMLMTWLRAAFRCNDCAATSTARCRPTSACSATTTGKVVPSLRWTSAVNRLMRTHDAARCV